MQGKNGLHTVVARTVVPFYSRFTESVIHLPQDLPVAPFPWESPTRPLNQYRILAWKWNISYSVVPLIMRMIPSYVHDLNQRRCRYLSWASPNCFQRVALRSESDPETVVFLWITLLFPWACSLPWAPNAKGTSVSKAKRIGEPSGRFRATTKSSILTYSSSRS